MLCDDFGLNGRMMSHHDFERKHERKKSANETGYRIKMHRLGGDFGRYKDMRGSQNGKSGGGGGAGGERCMIKGGAKGSQ